jgi:hypothetical protein
MQDVDHGLLWLAVKDIFLALRFRPFFEALHHREKGTAILGFMPSVFPSRRFFEELPKRNCSKGI